MFIARLRPLYYISDKVIVRNVRNSRLSSPGINPGISNRLRAFRKEGLKVEEDEAEEYIERSDSDFSNVGKAYNEHMNEAILGKYELRHRIVKEKYFKENMPNLLTWSEKEQIRHLAATAPDEWTPEKLAESFPVTEETVKKLLKYPWKPATKERIERHDASVMRNWRELKEGTLSISEGLQKHFLKFSNRTIPPLNPKSIKIDLTQEKKMGEYEKIVQRCAVREKEQAQQNISEGAAETGPNKDRQNNDKKLMTLDELKDKIQRRLDSGKNIALNDEIIVNTIKSDDDDDEKPIPTDINQEIELYADKGKKLVEYKENEDKADHKIMEYPERIRIPKKAYKKGATYKVKDCYYDHDGRFLYRVLGMSNN